MNLQVLLMKALYNAGGNVVEIIFSLQELSNLTFQVVSQKIKLKIYSGKSYLIVA